MTGLQHVLSLDGPVGGAPALVKTASSPTCGDTAQVRRVAMVRCAATRAGLGRFVYLQGRSGRRYVFSAITAEQAPLYGNGVFAAQSGEIGEVEVGFSPHRASGRGALFVHLPDDNSPGAARAVLADI